MTHMPIKFTGRVDVGSACLDIRQSPKKDVLVASRLVAACHGLYGSTSCCKSD